MKIQSAFSFKRGFTLIELMVAMAITTIIVTILISITSMATDTWNRSRAELRASRQAKTMVDTMARDLESLVTRRGTYTDATKAVINPEWLAAVNSVVAPGDKAKSSNSSKLIFFAGATDRYKGDIGVVGKDLGGDVSGVAYELFYKDPIDKGGMVYRTFVFNRLLIDPKAAFDNLLGKPDLEAALGACPVPYNYTNLRDDQNAFVCENVYQFTITFHVQVSRTIPAVAPNPSKTETISVPVSIGNSTTWPSVTSLKIKGTGAVVDPARPSGVSTASLTVENVTETELSAGRVTAVELSITVLSDAAIEQIRRPSFSSAQIPTMLIKHAYNYSKRIQVPGN